MLLLFMSNVQLALAIQVSFIAGVMFAHYAITGNS